MALISDKWKNELNSLSQKDYITLTKAILFDLPEPQISANNQYIADRIYASLKERTRAKEGMQKTRRERNNSVTLQECYSNNSVTLQECYGQEERKEGVPPCSPLPLSPTPPITNPPIIPPYQEKREEALTGVCAGACEDEQISFEGFEPLDPPESEVKHRKPTIAERFDALWAEYPKKNGKKNAFESYQRAIAAGVTDETIADGIRRYKDYIAAKRTSEQYILAGSTYFYQWRWQDIYDTNTADGKDENGKPAWMSQEDWEEMNAVFG